MLHKNEKFNTDEREKQVYGGGGADHGVCRLPSLRCIRRGFRGLSQLLLESQITHEIVNLLSTSTN